MIAAPPAVAAVAAVAAAESISGSKGGDRVDDVEPNTSSPEFIVEAATTAAAIAAVDVGDFGWILLLLLP